MKLKQIVIILFLLGLGTPVFGQQIAVKTNALYWATTTPNLGVEFRLGRNMTLDLSAGYNPFGSEEGKSFEHLLVQPELRRWLFRPFTGTFVGLHLHGGMYDVKGIEPLTTLKENRYDGWFAGAGISVGHHWLLGARWGVEAEIGVGYAYLKYDKSCYGCETIETSSFKNNYFGPTRLNISLVYYLR